MSEHILLHHRDIPGINQLKTYQANGGFETWKKVVSKEACLTCHATGTGSAWLTSHTPFVNGGNPLNLTNSQCATCHVGPISSERVHWNQNEENAAKYKMNIEDVTYTPSATAGGTSTVTVRSAASTATHPRGESSTPRRGVGKDKVAVFMV